MPRSAPRFCAEHGCPELVVSGRCEAHRLEQSRQSDSGRANGYRRGYTAKWAEFSAGYLKEHAVCECDKCRASPSFARQAATDVDHTGGHSRTCSHAYDEQHLQALSHGHHARKTARDDGAFGRSAIVPRCRS